MRAINVFVFYLFALSMFLFSSEITATENFDERIKSLEERIDLLERQKELEDDIIWDWENVIPIIPRDYLNQILPSAVGGNCQRQCDNKWLLCCDGGIGLDVCNTNRPKCGSFYNECRSSCNSGEFSHTTGDSCSKSNVIWYRFDNLRVLNLHRGDADEKGPRRMCSVGDKADVGLLDFDQTASSVRVRAGYYVLAYKQKGFKGTPCRIEGNARNLGTYKCLNNPSHRVGNDDMSSFRVRPKFQ